MSQMYFYVLGPISLNADSQWFFRLVLTPSKTQMLTLRPCLFILLLCKYLSSSLCPSYYCDIVLVSQMGIGPSPKVCMGSTLRGRNFIPPRHLGSYFPSFIFMSSILFSKQSPPLLIYVIPLIFLHNPHLPLLQCICVCIISRHLNI